MSLNRLEKYLNIMLDICSTGNVTRTQISKKHELPYTSIVTLFKSWVKTDFISKIKISNIKAGEDQYKYEITNKGTEYLKNLSSIFDKYKTSNIKELKKTLEEFYKNLPKLIMDSKFDIYDDKIIKLIQNIKKYFKEEWKV